MSCLKIIKYIKTVHTELQRFHNSEIKCISFLYSNVQEQNKFCSKQKHTGLQVPKDTAVGLDGHHRSLPTEIFYSSHSLSQLYVNQGQRYFTQGNAEYFIAMITHMEVTSVKLQAPKRNVKSVTNSNAYHELDLDNKLLEVLEKISLFYLNKAIFICSQLFSIYLLPNSALSKLFFCSSK